MRHLLLIIFCLIAINLKASESTKEILVQLAASANESYCAMADTFSFEEEVSQFISEKIFESQNYESLEFEVLNENSRNNFDQFIFNEITDCGRETAKELKKLDHSEIESVLLLSYIENGERTHDLYILTKSGFGVFLFLNLNY